MSDETLIKIARVIASFHRNSCYPEADPIELEVAARAVLAVTSDLHDELIAALERCEAMVSADLGPPDWDWVRDVLAKAKGETP